MSSRKRKPLPLTEKQLDILLHALGVRIRALGNSVVPQCAQVVGEVILAMAGAFASGGEP